MKKIVCLLLCVITLGSVVAPVCFASEKDEEIMITLDVNERYTDISEMNEDDPFLSKSEETLNKERNKKVYIAVLVVLLLVSLCILLYTLKKVPSEKEIEEKNTEELLNDNSEEE